MASTNAKCAGCLQEITNREFLDCILCSERYDLECANVPTQRFYNTMTKEHKQRWKCQACHCKTPKGDNSNTPLRQRDENDLYPFSTPSENTNITKRNPRSNLINESICSEDMSLLGNTMHKEKSNNKIELNLENLSELIELKLKENNSSIIADLRTTIAAEINKAMLQLKAEIKPEINLLSKQNEQRKKI